MLFAADARQLSNFPKVGREAGMKPLKKWKRHCKSYDKIQRIPGQARDLHHDFAMVLQSRIWMQGFISKMTMLFKVRCLFHRFFGGGASQARKGSESQLIPCFLITYGVFLKWWFPKMNAFLLEKLIKVDGLGVPLFQETSMYMYIYIYHTYITIVYYTILCYAILYYTKLYYTILY